jgi:putative oxidoreductase
MNRLDQLRPLGLLLLRLALGVIFIYHGYPKLFGQTARHLDFFQQLGLMPQLAYVAGVLELFGGALLIMGFATRIAALLLAGEMAVVIWVVRLGEGILAVGEYEFPLALAAAAFLLATTGAGAVSLDALIYRDKAPPRKPPR